MKLRWNAGVKLLDKPEKMFTIVVYFPNFLVLKSLGKEGVDSRRKVRMGRIEGGGGMVGEQGHSP
jgi:hypothetical protein